MMQSIRKRMVWRYSIIILFSVTVLETFFIIYVKQYYYGSIEQVLTTRAAVGAAFNDKYIGGELRDRAQRILGNEDDSRLARIEILDKSGRVVIDSDGFSGNQIISTPDVAKGMSGEIGKWTGKLSESGEWVMAVTAPLKSEDHIIGGLRYITSLENTREELKQLVLAALFVGFLVVIVAFVLSMILARSIIIPIRSLTHTAGQMAAGDYSQRAEKYWDDEIGGLADTLNLMAEEINRSEKIKSDFLSSISHELRTPLTSIKGWSETLLSRDKMMDEEATQGVEIISKESNRVIGLVENLLDFSRYQVEQITLKNQLVDINRIAVETSRQFMIRARENKISLKVDCQIDSGVFWGDRDRLKQVLVILLDNALKFTPEGGTIEVNTLQKNDEILIEVADTGDGIAPEHLNKVKEKFYKGSSKRPGSGIGLSIAEEIVHLHKGRLEISSEQGKGTIVEVYLPVDLLTK